MPADDTIYLAVKNALIKDGWTITHDPYRIKYGTSNLYVDLGAERPAIAAERGDQMIAVEIKSFLGPSLLHLFEEAVGQFLVYRFALRRTAPERKLYMAVSDQSYTNLRGRELIDGIMAEEDVPVVVIRIDTEEVVQWIR
jgi:hypothetical protein